MAGVAPSASATDAHDGARGLRAFTPALWRVQWPRKFKPEMPPHYDGAADPLAFLLAYEEAVLKVGGDDRVMANWFPRTPPLPGCSKCHERCNSDPHPTPEIRSRG